MAVTYLLLLVSFGALSWHFLKKKDNFFQRFSGPVMLPFIGNLWFLARTSERLKNLEILQAKYGNRVHLAAASTNMLLLYHPDDVAKVLSSKEVNRSWLYDLMFKGWLGPTCLLTAKGKEYFRMRKLYTPAFSYKQVENFQQNFNFHSKMLLNILKKDAANGLATEVRWLLKFCTLDTISDYLLGKSMECLAKLESRYAAAVHNETKNINKRVYMPWLWPTIFWSMSSIGRKEAVTRKYLQDQMDKIVQERKSEILLNNTKNSLLAKLEDFQEPNFTGQETFLDYALSEQIQGRAEFTDRYIRDLMNSAILAGHETTAAGLTFALYLLAKNPKEQAKLLVELDEVFGTDRDRNVETSDLPKLKFLECCIKEAERLYPPIPLMPRLSDNEVELDKKCVIPKGVDVMVSPWVTHRLPEFFPQPEEFRPSRFFPENSIGRHPYAYIAFSAGPRNCMGIKFAIAQEKIILADIFRNFIVELDDPTHKVEPVGDVVMFPNNELKIKLKPR